MTDGTNGVVTAESTGAGVTDENVTYDLVYGLDLDTKRKVARYFDVKLPKDKAIEVATNKDLNNAFNENEIDDSLYQSIYLQDEAGGKPAEESDLLDPSGESEPENADAKAAADDADEDKAKVENEEKILLKMTRPNFLFEAYGYTFSKEHPFALVEQSVAEQLVKENGFQPAMPSELEEYYN